MAPQKHEHFGRQPFSLNPIALPVANRATVDISKTGAARRVKECAESAYAADRGTPCVPVQIASAGEEGNRRRFAPPNGMRPWRMRSEHLRPLHAPAFHGPSSRSKGGAGFFAQERKTSGAAVPKRTTLLTASPAREKRIAGRDEGMASLF